MQGFLAAAVTLLNYYPGFTDVDSRIEAVIDRGLVAELVVRCEPGTAIIAASMVDQTYCTPKFACYAKLDRAISESCHPR
jgi:hypothetical protein